MKHIKYLRYLLRHKWFVFVAGLHTGVPLWRLIIHDWSKFLPSEWFAYARFFYGNLPCWDQVKLACPAYDYRNTREGARELFEKAWLHHQHHNPHHWQHWILREDSGGTKALPMPNHYLREMVADWMGAGRAITGKWDAPNWYAKNRDIIVLHPATRPEIERLLAETNPR